MFGDFRPGRYHAGFDLRTGGEEGWPVVAVGDGYVMRASTSYFGYGRALYLRLDDGRIAVYGHLQKFGPEVTKRVRAEQKRLRLYNTNQYFEKDEIRVRKGMIIARSGQTGAGAPHLHFELRTGDNKPINPLLHGFSMKDRRDPEIKKLYLVPGYENGEMGRGPHGPIRAEIKLQGNSRAPLDVAGGPIYVSGPIGFAIEAYDHKPGTSRRYNITGLLLIVGGDTVFQARFDTLKFSSMSQVLLERLTTLDADGDVYALYKSTGNRLAHSQIHPDYPKGLVTLQPGDSAVPLKIVVTDERKNRRTILGTLTYRKPALLSLRNPDKDSGWTIHPGYFEYRGDNTIAGGQLDLAGLVQYSKPLTSSFLGLTRFFAADVDSHFTMDLWAQASFVQRSLITLLPGTATSFELDDGSLELKIPEGAVYETCFLTVEQGYTPDSLPFWRMGPKGLLLKKPIELSFVAPDDSSLGIWTWDTSGTKGFVEMRRTEGRIDCSTGQPETFSYGRDTTAPSLTRVSPREGARVRSGVIISARIEDEGSGIASDSVLSVWLDGEWIPPEYDPEQHLLVAHPWKPLSRGEHTLEIRVQDWAGNITIRTHRFKVVRK